MRTCVSCKCTERKACPGGCSWMPGCGDVCSACVLRLAPIDLLFVLFGQEAAEEAWAVITGGLDPAAVQSIAAARGKEQRR